jgi:hypothetical protein
MKTIVLYPIPLDNWTVFEPFAERFTRTFRQFPPGEDCEVWGMCCMALPNDSVRQLFDGIVSRFVPYYHISQDSCGSHQFASWLLEENTFMVGMTSRCYFHRSGWLTKLVEARRGNGPGLYGLCANRETHALHICCRCYAMDSDDYKNYPYVVNTRAMGLAFETGDGIPEGPAHVWMQKRGRVAKVVMWDGVYDEPDWFTPSNRFRNGDQSNMLVFDKHTDAYRDGTPEQRAQLEAYQLA